MSNIKEIWKDLNGFYEVSNLGNVKSTALKNYDAGGRVYSKKERILKPAHRSDGYLFVNISNFRHRRPWKVHQLVAFAFIPNPNDYNCINHINGIKTDNRVENLEWCTEQENVKHSFEVLKRNPTKLFGKNNSASKSVINTITRVVYVSVTEASESIGMKHNTLYSMLTGRNKNKTDFIFYESTT